MQNLVSIDDLTTTDLDHLFERATAFKKHGVSGDELRGWIVGLLFFSPSTRTRLSFDTAAKRLGAQTIGFDDSASTSISKGETLSDTIRVVEQYCDLLVIRHAVNGSAAEAAATASIPVINAGDGTNEHPTQCLLDLYTIAERHERFENLTVGFIGDLRYARIPHSSSVALARLGSNVVWIAPEPLQIPEEIEQKVAAAGGRAKKVEKLDEVIADLDVLYVERPKREFWGSQDLEQYVSVVNRAALANAKPSLSVMHALPRTNELSTDIDDLPNAAYFEQVANSVPIRMALLCELAEASGPPKFTSSN